MFPEPLIGKLAEINRRLTKRHPDFGPAGRRFGSGRRCGAVIGRGVTF
jgi:hypothetical protein